jgi:PHD/YefM family antitoxin component YafN of YafNO toxin-antitoxin module
MTDHAMQEFPAATLTRDPTSLKEEARKRPVAITEYKRRRFVLMSYDQYLALEARAADPRRSFKAAEAPDDVRALALEALDQPYER